jgi:hypothetical protein
MKEPVMVERHGNIYVVRDDLFPGGSKARFLPALIGDAKEIVFGGPCMGGAPVALSVVGKQMKRKITLFYAKRKVLHRRQQQAQANGARIIEVPMGFISNVQAKARAYCARTGALFLPLGFDRPDAREPYVAAMTQVHKMVGDVDEVWCATSSGMLTFCLALAFPNSHIRGVAVGLASRWTKQKFPSNVEVVQSRYKDLGTPCPQKAPFPICPHYEAKVWEHAKDTKKLALFWNVIGA